MDSYTQTKKVIALRWNETHRAWKGSAELDRSRSISISISWPGNPDRIDPLRKWARTLFDFIVANGRDIRGRIARGRLLALYNANWRDEDEPELSAGDFAERIEAYALVIYEAGRGDLFYRDGGLFAGHSLVASLDERLEVTGVELYG